jgi:hypothetical protein
MTAHQHEGIRHWSVYSGRTLLGVVDAEDDAFIARDRAGRVVGEFDSLLVASRALELVEGE